MSRRHTARRLLEFACLAVPLAAGTHAVGGPVPAEYGNVSAPATLQLFESSWGNMEHRAVDAFMAGYGAVWVPPPGRAESGGFSVGYDQYDRFDLGRPGDRTLYGTERGLKSAIDTWHRFGANVYADLVWNHNGFADLGTPGFQQAGDYPGFLLTHPDAIDGDFHGAFETGDRNGRISGLIDIDHSTNFQYIRNPVDPSDPRNLPPGVASGYPRIADVASEANRRFYQSQSGPGRLVFDPKTGETFTVHDFAGDGSEATSGAPVTENALGYLMRNAQWYVQDVGFDGFRLDATKHYEPWVLNYLDRAVFEASHRDHLDGSKRHVFSFGEALDANMGLLQSYVDKGLNPFQSNDPGQPRTIGGNRDTLDFPLHFALKDNLRSAGVGNSWHNVINASFDVNDDGLANNGSQGVAFDASHDDFGAELGNVANAYLALRPGNWVVYHNAKEFGDGRDFPKDGRGDALGGLYGDTVTTLVGIRNTHGRGNYHNRLVESENLAYERERSAIVLLSNRGDAGFDSRTIQTGFAPGTWLVELTGNAETPALGGVDPRDDIPSAVQVNADGTINARFLRNGSYDTDGNPFSHGKGYLVYGLATPQGELSLSNVAQVLAGGTPTPGTNGTTRLADIEVITADTFDVRLQTQQVNILGQFHDPHADGDNALLRFNEGLDVNRNGAVDHVDPGIATFDDLTATRVDYGFEQFLDKRSPLWGGGDGEFLQTVHADDLVEGLNFLEVRAFRHRDDGGPPVYSSFKKAIYIDRYAPESEIWAVAGVDDFREFQVRSIDRTANSVHTFLNLPASLSDAEILAMVSGGNKAGQIDRDLFAYGYDGVASGNNVLTVVTWEITGNVNVQRFAGLGLDTTLGAGLGDLDFDGAFTAADVFGAGAFEQFLWSQDTQFNPAGDLNGDGRTDTRDLFALRHLYSAAGAPDAAAEARQAELRRGNVNLDATTDQADIDFLHASLGQAGWILDLDSDTHLGDPLADRQDVDTLIRVVLLSEYGDADLSLAVDWDDYLTLRDNYGRPGGWAMGDFSGNGVVDWPDFLILQEFYGWGTPGGVGGGDTLPPVPEPAAGILVAGSLLLLRRRRGGRGQGG